MACKNCTSGSCGAGAATKKNKGEKTAGCGSGACGTGGCNKMNSYDWLFDMELAPAERFDVVEVRFKNGRKEFFRNTHLLDLTTGDAVSVEAQPGFHVGYVALQGELVRLQMLKKGIQNNDDLKSILRLASAKDLDKQQQAQARDLPAMFRTRQIIQDMKLRMKLSDVEFQSDNTKATFYYSADDRVDFRELIKILASEFKVRIEMKQISLRQEAGRLGGIGVCGRELCCSTWLSDFKSVSTSAARYQNLSLNPSKLSGQCGRLKCCLNYELDTYVEALKEIPLLDEPIQTLKGPAHLHKTDIFKKLMWFAYNDETNWYPVTVERVKQMLEMNTKDQKPFSLEKDEDDIKVQVEGSRSRNASSFRKDKDGDQKAFHPKKKKKKKKGGKK